MISTSRLPNENPFDIYILILSQWLSGKFFNDQPIITACGGSDRMEWNDLLLVYSIHRFFYTCVDGSSSL